MIGTIIRTLWIRLLRDRVALVLTFVLPIIFFSIFATIFGGMGGGSSSGGGDDGSSGGLATVVVDLDQSVISARLRAQLEDHPDLDARPMDVPPERTAREVALELVREARIDVAILIQPGFGDAFAQFGGGDPAGIEIIHDVTNPMSLPAASGIVQATAFMAAPDILMETGMSMLEQAGGTMTPTQRLLMQQISPALRGEGPFPGGLAGASDGEAGQGASAFDGFISINATDPRAAEAQATGDDDGISGTSIVTYYAAGIGVMFLLFSMAGAAGTILEEEEQGTLERILTSNTSMTTLLISNWLFFAVVGVAQLLVMFLWGKLVFGVSFHSAGHIITFLMMTVITASAASAFGLVLATICRSRAQLSGVSTVVILIMSALGGSMVPRFAMPAFMDTTALFTFNGWALDGYLDVFWHSATDESLGGLLGRVSPELGVLAAGTVVFLVVARLSARRWETA